MTAKFYEKKNYKWMVLVMLMLVYIFTYAFAMTALSTVTRQIMTELDFTLVQMSGVVGALPLSIACFTFVAGILLDKLSTRWLMAVGIAFCCLSIMARGFATSFGIFYAVMFALGIGQAMMFPGVAKVIAMYFGKGDIFRANGILISGAPIGMIMGYNLSLPISNALGGWQNMFILWGSIGILVAIIWAIVIRDIPKEEQALNKDMGIDTQKSSVLQNLKAVLGLRQTWFVVIADLFTQGFIQTILSFAAAALAAFPGYTAQIAGTTSSMGNLGSLFGYYILPPIAERAGVRKPFIWPFLIVYAAVMMVGFMSNSFLIAGICFFVGSFFNGWTVPGGRTLLMETPEIAGLRSGTAIGLLITMQRIGAAVVPIVYAALVTNVLNGDQMKGITILCILPVIAAVLIFFAKETGMGREAAKKLYEERKAARLSGK